MAVKTDSEPKSDPVLPENDWEKYERDHPLESWIIDENGERVPLSVFEGRKQS